MVNEEGIILVSVSKEEQERTKCVQYHRPHTYQAALFMEPLAVNGLNELYIFNTKNIGLTSKI